jgi:hypothetical protein
MGRLTWTSQCAGHLGLTVAPGEQPGALKPRFQRSKASSGTVSSTHALAWHHTPMKSVISAHTATFQVTAYVLR